MAKRLSSFFSSKDEDLPQSSSSPQLSAPFSPQSPSRGKLTKPMTKSPSGSNLSSLDTDLEPPPFFGQERMSSRPSSRDGRSPLRVENNGSRQSSGSRPQTPTTLSVPGTSSPLGQSPNSRKLNKRRSWIPGKSEKQTTDVEGDHPPVQAWIAGLKELFAYDIKPLLSGEPVGDLWNNDADVLVYLFPETARKGPSFRVHSQLFADSRVLSYLMQPIQSNGNNYYGSYEFDASKAMSALSFDEHYSGTAKSDYHTGNESIPPPPKYSTAGPVKAVRLPLNLDGDYSAPGSMPKGDDLELIVLYRNFFSFLCGGALIATHRQNTLFAIFMSISSILSRLQYGNEKESSWGNVPWHSFMRYTEELRLADVRTSREKNIEAILIGVAMKSWPLYVEGFVHAVGRLDDIKSINSPKFNKIPAPIVNKLERARLDLQTQRLQPLHAKLDNFYFPSMFAGIANSQTATEAKLVRFKAWKAYFMDFRQYTMAQYKRRYGSWPPKASSKKNNFEESGLNRQLLREVYQDFTDLYDMLADRTSITPRTVEVSVLADDAESGTNETIQHALRSVESEYDRSTPPVTPPIPFDVPIIPAFQRHMLAIDAQNTKKLRDNTLNDLLYQSYNKESVKSSPWIQEFIEYERKLCHGKTISDLGDIRCGQWLFMYAVLQSLPMTVVDARDLSFTEGVEYFLCEAPRGGRPWVQDDVSTSRAWFNVASGGGLVSMPADVIDHGVEGIYRRSHCWTIATKWASSTGPISPVSHAPPSNHFLPPKEATSLPYLAPVRNLAVPSPYQSPLLKPVLSAANDGAEGLPRIPSRTSMNLGLEEVAAPEKVTRPVSKYNPNITFDNIIASQQIQQKSGKKGKK